MPRAGTAPISTPDPRPGSTEYRGTRERAVGSFRAMGFRFG